MFGLFSKEDPNLKRNRQAKKLRGQQQQEEQKVNRLYLESKPAPRPQKRTNRDQQDRLRHMLSR